MRKKGRVKTQHGRVGRGGKDKDGRHSQPCRWRHTKTTHISLLNLYPTLISSSGREGLQSGEISECMS